MGNTVKYIYNNLYDAVEAYNGEYLIIRTTDLVMRAFKNRELIEIFDFRDKIKDMTVREFNLKERDFCKKYGVNINEIGSVFKENFIKTGLK